MNCMVARHSAKFSIQTMPDTRHIFGAVAMSSSSEDENEGETDAHQPFLEAFAAAIPLREVPWNVYCYIYIISFLLDRPL